MANGRAKGQVSLKGGRGAKNTSRLNPHTVATVGLRGAKPSKNVHSPRLHSRPSVKQEGLLRTKGSKTSTNLGSPRAVNTVGLKGASVPSNRGTSSNLRKTSPRAVNIQGLKSASKRAPLQSLQSAGTGGKSGGSRKVPFAGNRRQVGPSKKVVSSIPAVVRRAAARKAPGAGATSGSIKFTSRVAKILSK